jgi:hypothetical protein
MSFKILTAVAVLCLSAPFVAAQAKRVEIRMLAFSADLDLDEAYAHDPATPGAASVKAPIKTYLNNDFSTIQLASPKISFTTKPDPASLTREGELIGEVNLPSDVNSAILLFLPSGSGGKAKCIILPINDSKRAFPAGSYHATNLSPFPVRLELEEKKFEFKPGQTLMIEDPPTREGGRIGMHAFAFEKKAWNPIGAGLWSHPGATRKVLVLFLNPETKTVQLRAYSDVPPREPQAAPAAP